MADARFDDNLFVETEIELGGKSKWVLKECYKSFSVPDAEAKVPCGFHCIHCNVGAQTKLNENGQIVEMRPAVIISCKTFGPSNEPLNFNWPQGESMIIKPTIQVDPGALKNENKTN